MFFGFRENANDFLSITAFPLYVHTSQIKTLNILANTNPYYQGSDINS